MFFNFDSVCRNSSSCDEVEHAKNEDDYVLFGLSEALRKTGESFLKSVDEMINNNSMLAMMGSCVLVMLMKGEDVYLMNAGDNHVVLVLVA